MPEASSVAGLPLAHRSHQESLDPRRFGPPQAPDLHQTNRPDDLTIPVVAFMNFVQVASPSQPRPDQFEACRAESGRVRGRDTASATGSASFDRQARRVRASDTGRKHAHWPMYAVAPWREGHDGHSGSAADRRDGPARPSSMRASMNSTAARSVRPPRIVITLADVTRATDPVLADDKNELYIAAIRRAGGDPLALNERSTDDQRRQAFAAMERLAAKWRSRYRPGSLWRGHGGRA